MKATPLELLAPARNADIAIEAVRHGADAVYIGAPAFGARAAAVNSVDDIARAVEFAHRFGARVYCTMNTIVYDHELQAAESLVHDLYRIGVDALIVQDMAYLEMNLPPIALHASTQCDIRTPEKARLLAQAGFSQLVLPRELSLEEIAAMRAAVDVPLEAFVHGALCVSYSGDCQAGFLAMGRSANRGECPQMCRLPYDLIDGDGNVVRKGGHFLSLRDMNRLSDLGAMAEAGISSFKIEGRLKDAAYVKNVVSAYSDALDRIVAASGGKYVRASFGKVSRGFVPSLTGTFNRGYTSYFLNGMRGPARVRIATVDSPKWTGEKVAVVTSAYDSRKGFITARASTALANGDGLGYFDASRRFVGFRLNKVEGDRLYPATKINPPVGAELYRNHDKAFLDTLESATSATRGLAVKFILRPVDDSRIALEATDCRVNRVCVVAASEYSEARSPQQEPRRRTLAKLGGTDYVLEDVEDTLGNRFVAVSVLTALRRDTLEALDSAWKARYAFDRRRKCTLSEDAFSEHSPLTYHDNVANRLSRHFYESHGASVGHMAVEVESPSKSDETVVMSTRYCLRRELGACLRDKQSTTTLRGPLRLRSLDGNVYRLDFDCSRCGMQVVAERK